MLRFFQENIGILAAARVAQECAQITPDANISLEEKTGLGTSSAETTPPPFGMDFK